ncbi:hypothetical protein ACFRQM_47595 [Streptomyces sp. NPDC056831]|uniref:hypothetical protein n=1 Tax=Streptomyces sp. NPDC056831 TaxID=3345954 RepID=UPI0036B2933F
MSTRATSHSTKAERQIPARLPDVGPGWHSLLERLHQDLLGLAPDYQLDSLARRFGGLRIHLADRFDEDGEFDGDFADRSGALVDAVEIASEKTCEQCGQPGRPRFHGDQHHTWITALCDTCHARPRTPEPSVARLDKPAAR